MIHEQLTRPIPALDASDAAPLLLSRQAERTSTLGTVGALILAAALAIVFLSEHSRSVIFLAFVAVTIVAPLPAAYMLYFSEQGKLSVHLGTDVVLAAVKCCLLAALMAVIVFTVVESVQWPRPTSLLAPAIAFLATIGVVLFQAFRRRRSFGRMSQYLDAAIIVALAAIIFAYSPYDPRASQPIGLLQYAEALPHFGRWLLLGFAWTLVGIWIRRREGWAFPYRARQWEIWALVAAAVVVLSLYDDSHFTDFAHYAPLVGPAMHAMRGGVPMVDTYSQYGFLPFVIPMGAFSVFEPTFGTAAVVVRFIDLAYVAVVLAILCFVSRRRLSALWFFLPAVLVQLTSHNTGADGMWNLHALPMTLGGRWLLPAGMALLLVATPARPPWARWVGLALIALASLSSFEILAFTLAPWGYCLVLDSIRARSHAPLLRQVALALAAIAAAQVTMVVVIYLASGALVDYRPYLDAVLQHRPSEESDWSMPFVPSYALWLPLVCTYFLVMAIGSYRAVRGLAPVIWHIQRDSNPPPFDP